MTRTLCPQSRRILNAATGYCELGLWRQAWEELRGLPIHAQRIPAALSLKISICIAFGKWDWAVRIAEPLTGLPEYHKGVAGVFRAYDEWLAGEGQGTRARDYAARAAALTDGKIA
jgi:hypothetical protein